MEQATTTALAHLAAGVDLLLDAELDVVSSPELVSLLHGIETVRRRLAAIDHRVLAEAEARHLAGEYGRTSTLDLLVTELRVSPPEARARVCAAVDLGPRRTLTGQPLPPLHPATAAAQRAGVVSAEHARVITACLGEIPADAGPATAAVAESMLVEAATHQEPRALAQTARMLLLRLDPDGREPREQAAERRREFTLLPRRDGTLLARGLLTAPAGAALATVLDALSAPRPDPGGTPDARTAGQRRHDALEEMCLRVLRSGALPDCGGTPVSILLTTTVDDLRDPDGVATTAHGAVLSTTQLRQLGAEAEILHLAVTSRGLVLNCRRAARLATRWQRRALAARDGGCSFPGCTRPPAWCEAHHVIDWVDGGRTDLDNLTLLCPFHHRHHVRLGWQVHLVGGLPEWSPPPWVAPAGTRWRNTARHPPDLALRRRRSEPGPSSRPPDPALAARTSGRDLQPDRGRQPAGRG